MKPAKTAPAVEPGLVTLATITGEWVQAAEAATAAALAAELRLAQAMLTPSAAPEDAAAREAKDRETAAKIEDGFDNLPV